MLVDAITTVHRHGKSKKHLSPIIALKINQVFGRKEKKMLHKQQANIAVLKLLLKNQHYLNPFCTFGYALFR